MCSDPGTRFLSRELGSPVTSDSSAWAARPSRSAPSTSGMYRESCLRIRSPWPTLMRVSDAAAETEPRQQEATQSLSQFAARVLDQMSVSAWLPAAALVLAAAFLIQLGSVLDEAAQSTQQDPSAAPDARPGSSTPTITTGGVAQPASSATTQSASRTATSFAPYSVPSSASPPSGAPNPLTPDQHGAILRRPSPSSPTSGSERS